MFLDGIWQPETSGGNIEWEEEHKKVAHPYTGKWLSFFATMDIYMHLSKNSLCNLKV